MKKIILLIAFFFSSNTLAATKAHFLGFQAMIQILGSENGSTNPDAGLLYEYMNVPEQGSAMGPGKGIVSPDKILNFTCARQKNYQCSILVRTSPNVIMDSKNRIIQFSATGEIADELSSHFFLNENKELHFISTDGLFRLEITPGNFKLVYNGSGV